MNCGKKIAAGFFLDENHFITDMLRGSRRVFTVKT